MSGTLFIVATPIGNLEDLTPRARQTLDSVSLIAAEDTRHTGRLLSHIGCKTRLMAMHDHNEAEALRPVIRMLQDGESVALVSDAGTPLVSDPGFRLVRAAHAAGIAVSPVPGASAVTAALSAAGIATDRFCFEGFAPAKRVARQQWLEQLATEARTIVLYESVHRIVDCLADMVDAFGADRRAFIGREMTKMHEQCVQGTLLDLSEQVASGAIKSKGEFVIVVSGNPVQEASAWDVDVLLRELARHLPAKEAARISAKLSGEKKNALYDRLLQLKE
ncbi:MAG: 16S rRNA (cytidine(1402)-2'-O)-methyltransferase [Gammaproteobacteria bacterium]|nr:16S rRNA (cytidine(1402)-2'-O)-methyltransferase [Gammaproteobacteria bacterium]